MLHVTDSVPMNWILSLCPNPVLQLQMNATSFTNTLLKRWLIKLNIWINKDSNYIFSEWRYICIFDDLEQNGVTTKQKQKESVGQMAFQSTVFFSYFVVFYRFIK